MKVLVVVPTLASYPFLRDLCLEMVSKGWQVHVASSGSLLEHHESDREIVHFHQVELPRGMNPLAHLRAAALLNAIVVQTTPDVIDVHFSAAVFTIAVARKKHWPPTIATVQGLRFPLTKGATGFAIRAAECWSAKKMDKFFVLTDDDLEEMKGQGIKAEKQRSFGFGCDLEKFDRSNLSESDLQVIRKKVNKGEDSIVVAFVGRLVAFKGFHLVVRSFLTAFESNKKLILLVCGEYDKIHPSGLTEDEQEQIAKHPSIVFAGWTNKIEQYLAVTDFVVFPSEREGVPVNLMEALSMGVPVVTCDRRGCREVMDGGDNGVLLQERSVESLTQAVVKMADDHTFRQQRSAAAYAYRSNFDRQHFVNEHIEVLNELAGS